MSDDDAQARQKRATALRKQIADLTGDPKGKAAEPDRAGESKEGARRDAPQVHPPSPRVFIERRMRELDREPDGAKDED